MLTVRLYFNTSNSCWCFSDESLHSLIFSKPISCVMDRNRMSADGEVPSFSIAEVHDEPDCSVT